MSLEEYAKSEQLKNIKQSLLSGNKIPECRICWQHEENNLTSKRQFDNKTYDKIFRHKFKENLLVPNNNFVEYYVRMGNHCNLRCPTCDDRLSTGWISEKKKFGETAAKPWLTSTDHEIWNHILDHRTHVGMIDFIGGEPFMMLEDKQTELLSKLVESNDAKHIRLKYTSNATKLPNDIIQYWKHFKEVELKLSIDGIGKRFEYIRYPAVWQIANTNINHYVSLQQEIQNLRITIVPTVSIFNIGYLQEIIDYCLDKNLPVNFNMLEEPHHYNPLYFNERTKEWIVKQLSSLTSSNIDNMKQTIAERTLLEDHTSKFINIVSTLDKRRNTVFADTFPELACIISQT
jgi:organic radical activating enzyme